MAKTTSEYLTWLQTNNAGMLLVELNYHDGVSEKTVYLGTRSFKSLPTDTPANTAYMPLIRNVPEFSADMSGALNVGSLDIKNNGELDAFVGLSFGNRPIKLGLGDPSWARDDFIWANFRTAQEGVTCPDPNTLRLFFHDQMKVLDAPIQTSLLPDGKPIPLCYGTVFNVSPAFLGEDIDGAHYQVNDGSVDGITVRSGGLSVGGLSLDLPNGQFTIDPAPTGKVTCDVVNTTAGDLVGEIVEAVLLQMGVLSGSMDSSSFSAFNTAIPYSAGIYIDKRTNARQAIKTLLEYSTDKGASSSSSLGVLSVDLAGLFYLWRPHNLIGSESTAYVHYQGFVAKDGLSIENVTPPIASVRLGYQKNYTGQDEGSVFDAVSADDRNLYAADFQYETGEQVLTQWNEALTYPVGYDSALANAVIARTEITRLFALHSAPLLRYSLDTFYPPVLHRLGDKMRVTHPRLGFSAGVDMQIVGFQWQRLTGKCLYKLSPIVDVVGFVCDTYYEQSEAFTINTGKPICTNSVPSQGLLGVLL